MTDKLIKIALLISIFTYNFWQVLPKGVFYLGNAVFILLLSIIIFSLSRRSLWTFILLCLAANNLVDELFFDPTVNQLNEWVMLIVIPCIWYIRRRYYDRQDK